MEHTTLIKLKEISKSFDKKQILEKVSFELENREVLGILGYSGEGKSTLLNIITGLVKYDTGTIEYTFENGKTYNSISNGSFLKDMIGYSTQESSFYEELTVSENLMYFGKLLDVSRNDIEKGIKKLLGIFDLENAKNKLGSELSIGMKKRLDLACALIHSPKILILDEPTANLDFKLREEILTFIKKIKKLGVSVIYVSHIIEEVEDLSDKVLLLNRSKVKIVSSKNLKTKFLDYVKSNNHKKNEQN